MHCKAVTLRSGKTLEKSVEAHEDAKISAGDMKIVQKLWKMLKSC